MKKTASLLAVVLLAATAGAIELSLEENRGDRGSVGYVDVQRLFADSPDAQKAKEGFEDLVRQAEERVNLRKAELLKLHHELDQTRAQRDALSLAMSEAPSTATASGIVASTAAAASNVVAVSAPVANAVAVSTAAPAVRSPAPPAPVPSAVAASTPTANAVAVSTAVAAVASRPRELALPGMSTMITLPTAPPAAVAASSTATPSPAVARSSGTAAAVAASSTTASPAPPSVITSTGMAAAAAALFPTTNSVPAVAPAPAGPTPVQRLLEFDAKIIKIQAEIADKEAALMHEHDDADRGLLDIESRKTDQVLARIYRAVSEVARREGVSVVIEKTNILYGQTAVDLTDKVLKYLKEVQPQ